MRQAPRLAFRLPRLNELVHSRQLCIAAEPTCATELNAANPSCTSAGQVSLQAFRHALPASAVPSNMPPAGLAQYQTWQQGESVRVSLPHYMRQQPSSSWPSPKIIQTAGYSAQAAASSVSHLEPSSSTVVLTPTPAPEGSPHTLSLEQQKVAALLSAPPRSLECNRGIEEPPAPLRSGLGHVLLRMLGYYSHKSKLLHGAQELLGAIKEQVDVGVLQRAFGLDPSVFFSTYALVALHVWMSLQRLAAAVAAGAITEKDAKFVRQRFYAQFVADTEFRVNQAGVEVGVSKWLKKLEQMFFSMSMALDKAMRNEGAESVVDVLVIEMYGGETNQQANAALLARYLQHEMACLALTSHEAFLKGHICFSTAPFSPFLSPQAPSVVGVQAPAGRPVST